MADRDIDLRITAKDDASKVIDDVADELLALDDTTIEVDADTSDAESRISKFGRELEGLTDEAREIRITFKEGQLERQVQSALRELEKLEDPVAIAVRQEDLENTILDIKELRDLAGRDIEFRVNVDDGVSTSIDKVESSARAAGASVGTIGGAIGELPGISGLGPVAEGLGQLTEAALEGEAAIGDIGKALATMGGAAVVLQVVQKAMQSIADTNAFDDAQIESFRDALDETNSAASAVLATLREAEGVKGRSGGIAGLFEGTKDITAALVDAKVSADDFIEAVTPGPAAAAANQALTDRLRDQRAALEEQLLAMQASGEFSPELNNRIQLLGDAIEITSETLRNNTKAAEENVVSAEFLATATDKAAAATKASEDQNRRYEAGLRDAAAATDALREANEKLRGDIDQRTAYLNLEQTFEDLRVAGDAAMTAVATGAADADKATRDFELAQLAAKDEVLNYIDAIGDVPPEKQTDLLALVDQGLYDQAMSELDTLAKGRTVWINVYGNIDPKLLNSPYLPYIPKPYASDSASSTTNNLSVTVNATPSMRETDAAINRWKRVNGN